MQMSLDFSQAQAPCTPPVGIKDSESTQYRVSVPDEFWVKTARNDYFSTVSAVLREFLQNSRDAGANQIDLFLEPEVVEGQEHIKLTCQDNGCGMSADIIHQKLMALGASTKTDPLTKTGGFGVAKVLIFFAHPRYRIRTQNLSVIGSFGNYSVNSEPEMVQGTTAEVLLNPALFNNINYSITAFARKWVKDIERSWLPGIKVMLHTPDHPEGQLVVAGAEPPELFMGVEGTPHIWIYRKKLPPLEQTDRASVRCNGLFMFPMYKYQLPYQVVVEITGYPTEILTTNRDGLRDPWQNKVSRILDQMVLNPEFGKPKTECLHVEGMQHRKSPILHQLASQIEEATEVFRRWTQRKGDGYVPNWQLLSFRQELERLAEPLAGSEKTWFWDAVLPLVARLEQEQSLFEQPLSNNWTSEASQIIGQEILNSLDPTPKPTLVHHYFLEWAVKEEPVSAQFLPENLKPKYWRLLDLWATIIGQVMKAAGHPETHFDVGFLFENIDEADFDFCRAKLIPPYNQKFNSPYPIFLLNFQRYGEASELPLQNPRRDELTWVLLNAAIHEVTHFGGHYGHDSSFVAAESRIKQQFAPCLKGLLKLTRKL